LQSQERQMLCYAAIALLAGAIGETAPPGSAKPVSSSLVEAKLSKVTEITGQPGAPCVCDDQGRVMFDGSFRLLFSPLRTLAGVRVRRAISYDQASARPFTGGEYLLLIEHRHDGDVIVWKNPLTAGLCMEDAEIAMYHLNDVATKYPCEN